MVEAKLSHDDRELLAGEYALGVLDNARHTKVAQLKSSDPGFAALVRQWHERFAPLYHQYAAVDAPASVIDRVHAEIRKNRKPTNQVGSVIPLPANDTSNDTSQIVTQMRNWRRFAITASAIAASLALILVMRPVNSPQSVPSDFEQAANQPAQLQTVAQLSGEQPELFAVMKWNANDNRLDVRTSGIDSGGKVPELWVIGGDGIPKSLGQVPANSVTSLTVKSEARDSLADGVTIAMTFEEPSPVPSTQPTLPIVATGKLSEI